MADFNQFMVDPFVQSLIGAGGGLLSSSGWSNTPVSMGQAMGQGLLGMQQGYGNAMQNKMAQMKMAAAQKEIEDQKYIQGLLGREQTVTPAMISNQTQPNAPLFDQNQNMDMNVLMGSGIPQDTVVPGSGLLGNPNLSQEERFLYGAAARGNKEAMAGVSDLMKAKIISGGGGESPAAVKEWEYLKKQFPKMTMDFPTYLTVKRSGYTVGDIGGVPSMRPSIQGLPVIPLSTLGSEAAGQSKIAGDVRAAQGYGGSVGKDVANYGLGVDALTSIKEASGILDKGIYSGYWAELKKAGAKATPGWDKTKASNTEEYLSYIGNTVLPRLQEFGGSDTEKELAYLQDIQAGRITLEEKTMRNVLASAERKILAKMERQKEQAKGVGLSFPGRATSPKPASTKPKNIVVDY